MNKYHGKFGAVLFDKWGFSDKYIQTAMYHDDLSGTKQVSRELLVIHFANILVKSMGYGQDEDEIPELDQAASTRHLGFDRIPDRRNQSGTGREDGRGTNDYG
jgi:HD-like signal output (HDOD) protein